MAGKYERVKKQAVEILGRNHYGEHDWESIKQGNNPTVSQDDVQWIDETIVQILSLDSIEIKAANQDLTSYISFNLGVLQGEIGGLFDNYPENFNRIMNRLGEKLRDEGFIKVEPKEKS